LIKELKDKRAHFEEGEQIVERGKSKSKRKEL
jgi:hypothetical protein